jgi:hypothetical protein
MPTLASPADVRAAPEGSMKYRLSARQDAPLRPLRSALALLCAAACVLLGATLGAQVARADAPHVALPPLVLRRAHGGAAFTLTPRTPTGSFDAANLEIARQAFAWRDDDFRSEHSVSTHLLELVYQTMRHFDAAEVELVSGFRDGRATSRHSQGRAIDFTVPGVSMSALAEYVRTLGFVGVGIYPRSGFVHLDVRAESYFWVDYSRSGRRGRIRQILAGVAVRSDEQARARGEAPDAEVAQAELREKAAYDSGDPVARLGRARAARILARRERLAAERERVARRQRRQLRAGRAASDG